MANYNVPDNWAALPVKEAVLGGVKKRIKVDEGSGTIYLLDEHGNWTGEKTQWPGPAAGSAETQTPASSSTGTETAADGEEPLSPKKRKPRSRSKLTSVLLIIIAILGGLLLLQNNGSGSGQKEYEIIIAMENIKPGDTVEGKLAAKSVSAEEYYGYSKESGLYSPREYETIVSYVATDFIPANGCITYANVGQYFQVMNPWTMDIRYAITVPIDMSEEELHNILWGNKINLAITTRKSLGFEDYPLDDRPTANGVSGSSSVEHIQIREYILENCAIVDVLNAKKGSLYASYAGMTAIPESFQEESIAGRYTTAAAIESDSPVYIQIEVTEEIANWWKKATRGCSIWASTEWVGIKCDNELQNTTYLKLRNIALKIEEAWEDAGWEGE